VKRFLIPGEPCPLGKMWQTPPNSIKTRINIS
jgi:hypothetical protein